MVPAPAQQWFISVTCPWSLAGEGFPALRSTLFYVNQIHDRLQANHRLVPEDRWHFTAFEVFRATPAEEFDTATVEGRLKQIRDQFAKIELDGRPLLAHLRQAMSAVTVLANEIRFYDSGIVVQFADAGGLGEFRKRVSEILGRADLDRFCLEAGTEFVLEYPKNSDHNRAAAPVRTWGPVARSTPWIDPACDHQVWFEPIHPPIPLTAGIFFLVYSDASLENPNALSDGMKLEAPSSGGPKT